MLVYLAGPIDAVSKGQAGTWRMTVSDLLGSKGHMTFNPTRPYNKAHTTDAKASISIMNRIAIQQSDAVIVNLNGFAFGTIREIEFARAWNIPVVVVYEDADSLADHVEAWDLHCCYTLDEACDIAVRLVHDADDSA